MKLEALIDKAAQIDELTVAVAAAEEKEVLEAVHMAISRELAKFILFGDKEIIQHILVEKLPNLVKHPQVQIIHAPTKQLAVERAVKAVHLNEADVLMKGNVQTSIVLKAILNKEYGLRTGSILSQVAIFEIPDFTRYLFLTDAAMNVQPQLQEKVQIVQNAVNIARAVGIETPLVAPIAAVEVVNPNMEATVDAALLTQMNRRGQITNCIIDGPLGLDNAISVMAAEHKGINSEVAGHADILLVPTLEVGNILYKSLTYFAKAKVGSIIAGAKAPIVLTSRADSAESKLYSLALAICSVKKI